MIYQTLESDFIQLNSLESDSLSIIPNALLFAYLPRISKVESIFLLNFGLDYFVKNSIRVTLLFKLVKNL